MENNSSEWKYFLFDINSKFPFIDEFGIRCKLKYTDECYIQINEDGVILCYKIGTKLHHNTKGLAVKTNTYKGWMLNGKQHRIDGPACEFSNRKEYWINDMRHRLDGPAIEYKTKNDRTNKWWIEGKRLSLDKEKLLNIWYENKYGK